MLHGKLACCLAIGVSTFCYAGVNASGSVLLLDFGPTTPSNSDGSSTNTPGHATGAWSIATPTWNVVQDADVNVNSVSGTVSYYDGTTAGSGGTGVGLDLAATFGTATVGATTLTFGTTSINQPSATNALGTAYNAGIYANSSPARDGIFENPNNVYTAVGLNVSGLSAGTYAVYITARNTNASGGFATPENVWINSTDTSTSYTIPSTATALTEANTFTDYGGSGYIANENYVVGTVTISVGSPDLTIVTEGAQPYTTNESRGFLNSVEIVSTPEPASIGLLAAAMGLVLRRRRTFVI